MYHVTFPAQSNRASWTFTGLVTDLDDNPVDISACSMVFHANHRNSNYGLLALTDNGKLTFLDLGVIKLLDPAALQTHQVVMVSAA